MFAAGLLSNLVTLAAPGSPAAGTDGGYSESFSALNPSTVWCRIQPASPSVIERSVGSTIDAKITHLVTLRYHAGITPRTRVNFNGRYLYVRGVQNVEERGEYMQLLCEEVVS